jgi:3-phenylpropionate/trans-cinnamate dioxygenase ferredoxin component
MENIRVKLADLRDGEALRAEGGPYGICLARVGEDIYALADRCSHQNWPLSDGEVETFSCSIECTKHGSTFSLKDGSPQCLPATVSVAVYPVTIEGDEVVVSIP